MSFLLWYLGESLVLPNLENTISDNSESFKTSKLTMIFMRNYLQLKMRACVEIQPKAKASVW